MLALALALALTLALTLPLTLALPLGGRSRIRTEDRRRVKTLR